MDLDPIGEAESLHSVTSSAEHFRTQLDAALRREAAGYNRFSGRFIPDGSYIPELFPIDRKSVV